MTSYYRKNGKKGYTLAEVLTTVMILLILMAIAVPAIFSIRRNLRQKALDSKAELIYTAVQNNLVKMKSNGNSGLYAASCATPMGITPSDATEAKTLYYATASEKENQSKAARVLVTSDTVDEELYNNYWVVEYDPESASVYAVFYSETKGKYEEYTPSDYDNLRYKEERLSAGAWVGYYGGDAVDSSSTSTLAPKITIKNEEKLTASITCMRQDSKDLSFEVTLTDAENHSLTLKYKPSSDKSSLVHDQDALHLAATSEMDKNESSSIVGKKYTLNITLDDLSRDKGALRFAELYGDKNTNLKGTGLTAGTSLKIKVTVRSASSRVDGKNSEVTTNSLFADSSTPEKAVILYGRHLQNLDQESGVTSEITEAVQESNIHFEEQDDKEEGDTTSWYSCYKKLAFTPIANGNLRSYTGSGNTVIYHLNVENAVQIPDQGRAGAGMFAFLNDGMTVDSVRLSGTSISINPADGSNVSAGAIAGETLGKAVVSNCQVFLDTDDVNGKTDKDAWISGAACQGGLLGRINSSSELVKLTDSFAATVMDGSDAANSNVGGLVGICTGKTEINRCYADSYLTGANTGGLIADVSDGLVSIQSCYTAGYLKAASQAGGVIAKAVQNSADIKRTYAAINFVESEEADSDVGEVIRYAVGPAQIDSDTVFYLNQGNEDNGNQGKNVGYKILSNRTEMVKNLGNDFSVSTTTHPYNLRNQGLSSYSYPSLKNLQHYGDWQASYEAGSLVYYEVYGENSVRNVGFFGGNVESTLLEDKDNPVIIGDGYGIVYLIGEEPENAITVEYQKGSSATDTESISIDPKNVTSYQVKVSNNTYRVYPLEPDLINAAAISEHFYQKLTIKGEIASGGGTAGTTDQTDDVIDGKTFYFNPHFAKTVENTDNVPENPNQIAIRTARQLYHLSLYYGDYAACTKKSTFNQETDIDYTTYDWKTYAGIEQVQVQNPIGIQNRKVTAFAAVYNGSYHEIRGISVETTQTEVGFFGENSGTIQNVFLAANWNTEDGAANQYVNYKGSIGSNRTVYMGTLVGVNKGKIQNCAVSGYKLGVSSIVYVQRNGTAYMGGFVGSNQGTVLNCEAEAPSVNANVLYGNAYLGGFAGENTSAGSVRNSYAIGNVAVQFARGANAVIGGFAASNAGVLRTDYCAVAMTAAGSTSTYGFAPKGSGIINSDCYYLNGGTFQYMGKMLAFENDNQKGGGKGLSYNEMVEKAANSQAVESKYHAATSEESYPFAAVVNNSFGKVHYGNWQIPVDLGGMGVIYWELEKGGANNGYHFSYIGYTQDAKSPNDTLHMVKDSTLCQQHDDGGKISQYGYGYYFADALSGGTKKPDIEETIGFDCGAKNKAASDALSDRLDGFTVIAFTTEPSIKGTADTGSYMKMNSQDRRANGQWKFYYNGQTYTFTINPFFANSMQYGANDGTLSIAGVSSQSINVVDEYGFEVQADTYYPMPGTEDNEYEIRADDQLQYMNWNYKTGNAYTMLGADNYKQQVDKYPYLGYMYDSKTSPGGIKGQSAKYCWKQTHDVDAEMQHDKDGLRFTQLGSMFDQLGSQDKEDAEAFIAYFSGSYDGSTYYIKNVEIDSKNTTVGLFGSIVGAKVQNVILYSENGNYIQRNADSSRSWYALGGMCGLAAVGSGNSASDTTIVNCTVSGYTIRDNSTQSSWGDASIGGMFGMCTVDLKRCTAVNTIDLNCAYDGTKTDGVSVRVGGLVGSMRGNITSCYTGGKILCEDRCIKNAQTWAQTDYNAKLFLGGITGGIYIKNKGNLLDLLGNDIQGISNWRESSTSAYNKYNCVGSQKCLYPTTVISNCYTYIEMPTDQTAINAIKSIEPIGSNGETPFENNRNFHVYVKIENCYYYGNNIPTSTLKPFTLETASSWAYSGKNWTNIGTGWVDNGWGDYSKGGTGSTPIDWDQLAGNKPIEKDGTSKTLLGWLNSDTNKEPFGLVTTYENEQEVDGKYSFPGDRTDLSGENYPFPTILQQKEGIGYVNVHYGEWPLEGIYWKESRATMDIYENLVVDQTDENYGKAIKTFDLLQSTNVLGNDKRMGTEDYDLQVEYSTGADDAETDVASFSSEAGTYEEAFSDDTDESASFSSGAEVVDDMADTSFVGASDTTGSADSDGTARILDSDEYIAEVIGIQYDDAKGCYVATVKAKKAGTTTITVKTTGTDGQPYRASFSLTVTADLTVYSSPASVTQGVNQSTEVTLYAAPTAMLTSSNVLEGADDAADVGSDGFAAGDVSAESMDSEDTTFESDSSASDISSSEGEYVDMISDQDSAIAVYANSSQEPAKNLASWLTWEVTPSEEGPVSLTYVVNNRFKVTSEAEVPVTLTVLGTFTYEGNTYTSMTWIEVTTKEVKEIKWEKETAELVLNGTSTDTGSIQLKPNTETFNLNVPEGCINDGALTVANFTVTSADTVGTQSYTDGKIAEYADAAPIAEVRAVTRSSSNPSVYNVVIQGNKPGIVKVTVDVMGSDGVSGYTDSFTLKVKTPNITGQNAEETDDRDSVISGWGEPSDGSADFEQDADDGWQDNTEDYVDIVPNESYDNSTEDDGGWESGE